MSLSWVESWLNSWVKDVSECSEELCENSVRGTSWRAGRLGEAHWELVERIRLKILG